MSDILRHVSKKLNEETGEITRAEIAELCAELSAEKERATDAEAQRWAARLNWIHQQHEVDGSGTDSGDELDVIESEIRQALNKQKERAEKAEAALIPQQLPEGLVPHAYCLEATMRNADYWYKAGHNESNVKKAVMYMAQAMFAWKNAALAKAQDAMEAEAKLKEAQAKLDAAISVLDERDDKEARLEAKLKDAQEELARLREQEYVAKVNRQGFIVERDDIQLAYGVKLYAEPRSSPEVAELQKQIAGLERRLAEVDWLRLVDVESIRQQAHKEAYDECLHICDSPAEGLIYKRGKTLDEVKAAIISRIEKCSKN